jgi:hypothetical protein
MPVIDNKQSIINSDGDSFYVDSPIMTAYGDTIEFSMQINSDGEWQRITTTIPVRSAASIGSIFVKEGKLFLVSDQDELELKNGEMEKILLEKAALALLKK